MFGVIKRALILFCVLILISSPLFAQNDLLLLKVTPFPKKESLNDADFSKIFFTAPELPIPEKESMYVIDYNALFFTASLLPIPEKESMYVIDYSKIFFTASLLPKNQSRPANAFGRAYEKSDQAFWDFIDRKIHEANIKKKEEKKLIREAWKEWLGIDIWYPYFKAKEIEDWISDRTKIKIFKFRGRMKFENKRVTYTFNMKF